jgi:hypothetical protein
METASARSYVLALDLPDAPPRYESVDGADAGALGQSAPDFSGEPQALVVGSQLAEFTDRVDPGTREAVADSLLIAQLAANKAADQAGDVFGWYRKYVEVLQGVGWQVGSMSFESQAVSNRNADLHRAILPVVATMLGPAAAAGSLVMSVLEGLDAMGQQTPWIAVFDRASQHASGARFQVGRVDANGGDPEITVLCFGIDARRTVTQVLFFKLSDSSADLKKAHGVLSMSRARLMESRDAIAGRVGPFVADYVRNIDI